MRQYILFLTVLLTLTSCAPKPLPLQRAGYSPDAEEITKIVITYARDLKSQYGLFLYDSRVIFDDKIQKIRIDFTSQASLDLWEGRAMLVDIVEGYLERFRNHVVLGGKFIDRPVSPYDLEIHVTFQSYHNKYVDPGYLSYMIVENGWSYLYTSELDMPFTDCWMQRVEPYYKIKQYVDFEREAEEPYKIKKAKKSMLIDEQFYIESTDDGGDIITD